MNRITVLPKQVAELIAAGEVVERPASVVKELVENSIDAGATSITVEIQNGGVSFIRVTDDGSGILRDDVRNAFVSHATSKISGADDLYSIGTLGFRGEALASIAAVARVSLLTRTADELAGTSVTAEGGVILSVEDAGCPVGTTIVVRDLFYNTPARMKFLKKDVSEANAIAACLDRIALSHPEVSLRFIREQKTTLHTSGDNNLLSCAYGVFGRDFAKGLIDAEYEADGVRAQGLISKPEESRATRGMQYFFVNGRFVRTRTAMAALEEAFKGSIMVGRFPSCILNISLPYHQVDVNVHPAKVEVRFVNERVVFDAVYFAVKNALTALDAPPKLASKPVPHIQSTQQLFQPPVREVPEQQRLQEAKPQQVFTTVTAAQFRDLQPQFHDTSPPLYASRGKPATLTVDLLPDRPKVQEAPLLHKEIEPMVELGVLPQQAFIPPAADAPAKAQPQPPQDIPATLVGEVFDTYILLQKGEDILVVDKHAAHERILYEQLKAQHRTLTSQTLLVPVTVTLPKEEYAAITESLARLAEAGFEFEDFGTGSILVREFPLELAREDISAVVAELAASLLKNKRSVTPQVIEDLFHSIACRAAVKAHDKTGAPELLELIRILSENGELKHCPHGRPIVVAIEKKELEKRFGRV